MSLQTDRSHAFPARHLGNEPLFQHLLADPRVGFGWRAIDPEWQYHRLIPFPVSGFNPFRSQVFVSPTSKLAACIQRPDQKMPPPEPPKYRLAHEFLMAQHDYLHSWGNLVINELRPDLGYGFDPIDDSNFEVFVFCHMLTEAAAVVGLDYWHLCTFRLNERYDVGQAMRDGFVVSYHERDLDLYRKFVPGLVVQDPSFLKQLMIAYCKGYFEGCSNVAYKACFKLNFWAVHELSYGITQRRYTRQWLAQTAPDPIHLSDAEAKRPIEMDEPWRLALIEEMSGYLWDKVKHDRLHTFTRDFDRADTWRSPVDRVPDFRFINLNAGCDLPDDPAAFERLPASGLKFLFYQMVSAIEFDSIDSEGRAGIEEILQRERQGWDDFLRLQSILETGRPVESTGPESRDLFLPN